MKRSRLLFCSVGQVIVFFSSFVLFSPSASSEMVAFDSVLEKALERAHDLKIARTDLQISRYRLDEARSLYWPSFDVQLYNEYVHVPDENLRGIVSVGNSVSTALDSTYQHSLVASLHYELYDFGSRALKHQNARRELDIARLNLDRSRVDLRLQVLEAYARGLRIWHRRESALKILALRKKIYRKAQQLQEAGTMGRHRVEERALELADALGKADDLDIEYQNALNGLTFYTAEPYRAMQTAFSDLPDTEEDKAVPDVERLPEIRAIAAEIDGKKAEVEIARKEMLPRFTAYGAYRLYGSDTNSFVGSLNNMTERDATVAVVAEWNLFSGFRDLSRVRRLRVEIQRLRVQKEKRAAELSRDILSSYQAHRLLLDRDEQWRRRRLCIEQSRETVTRLRRRQLLDRIACLEHEADLVGHRLELELKRVDRAVAGLKLAFWREGQMK